MIRTSKILICLLLVMTLIVPCTMPTATASATTPVTVILDGRVLTFDVPPQIIDGRTMVPMRVIFEALGAHVSWNDQTRTVTATTSDLTVQTTIGNRTMIVNGASTAMDVAPIIVSGRTLVPVRFVSEAFGADVDWDAATRTVLLTSTQNALDNVSQTETCYHDGRDWSHLSPGTDFWLNFD